MGANFLHHFVLKNSGHTKLQALEILSYTTSRRQAIKWSSNGRYLPTCQTREKTCSTCVLCGHCCYDKIYQSLERWALSQLTREMQVLQVSSWHERYRTRTSTRVCGKYPLKAFDVLTEKPAHSIQFDMLELNRNFTFLLSTVRLRTRLCTLRRAFLCLSF